MGMGDGSVDHRQFISSLSIQLLLPLLIPLIAKRKVIKEKKNLEFNLHYTVISLSRDLPDSASI
jgi:hypothetical protein